LRIECYDISTLQGTNSVASMVVMEDGLPRKSEYRRFQIRGVTGQDDFAMMNEVITRRFRRYLDEQSKPVGERKFSYPPNLVIIDGGKGQLNAARAALDELGISGVEICGLAKRLEEVFLPDRPEPVLLPRASEALYLLQRVRDEAHRFAVTYHRTLRGRRMTESAFDEIPGVGPSRRRGLLDTFGSLKGVRAATVEELAQVPGISETLARTIHGHLHADMPDRAGAASPPGAQRSP
jgi:excinuclease ABC subunit C